jgi:hypothetical protein
MSAQHALVAGVGGGMLQTLFSTVRYTVEGKANYEQFTTQGSRSYLLCGTGGCFRSRTSDATKAS